MRLLRKGFSQKEIPFGFETQLRKGGVKTGVRFCLTAWRLQNRASFEVREQSGNGFEDAGEASFRTLCRVFPGAREGPQTLPAFPFLSDAGALFLMSSACARRSPSSCVGRPLSELFRGLREGMGEARQPALWGLRTPHPWFSSCERIRQVNPVSALVNFRHFFRFREPIRHVGGAFARVRRGADFDALNRTLGACRSQTAPAFAPAPG